MIATRDRAQLTVSAAALYLLCTLSVPCAKAAPVGDHLFPCCVHALCDISDQEDIVICRCPHGDDFKVLHRADAAPQLIPIVRQES